MGESPQIAKLVDYQTDITTLGYQMISIVGNKVCEALSVNRKQSQIPTPSPSLTPADKRKLHKTTGQVGVALNDSDDDLPQYTLQDVSNHDMPYDCWVILYDKVYDVTTFLREHPGGDDVMMEYAGRDATLAFRSVGHTKMAENSLADYLVGILIPEDRIWIRFFGSSGKRS